MKFTGERVIPGLTDPDLLNEHVARYLFASRFANGKRTLDAACGSGYGTQMLAESAQEVQGVDIDPEAIEYSRRNYSSPNSTFTVSDCTSLPFPSDSFDLVVAFEILEHLEDPRSMLDELRRVLAPGGLLILSTPNRLYYTEERGELNPFHHREYDYAEFMEFLKPRFPHQRILFQNHAAGLSIAAARTGAETGSNISLHTGPAGPGADSPGPSASNAVDAARTAYFFIALCSDQPIADPAPLLYMPSTGNVLRERELHIRHLQQEVAELKGHLDRALEREKELNATLEDRTRWAHQLDENLKALGRKYTDLHADFDDRTAWALRLDHELIHIHSTRWYRLGRRLGLSPDPPPQQPAPAGADE